MRLLLRHWFLRAALVGASVTCAFGCMQATQTYALVLHPENAAPSSAAAASSAGNSPRSPGDPARSPDALPTGMVGSLSVELIEGGQRLVVLQLEQLPPPERIAPGLREFVVWLEDPRGGEVNVGTLHYDRANHSGNLLATTDLPAFTIRVTGERDARAAEPTGVLLAERRVVTN
ncbi:MAG: hypothetical protein RLZZ450_1449 [Pseudomonadota bacterium]